MTNNLLTHWIPHERAVESQLGDETVILHLDNSTYYSLDSFGTKIWKLLKKKELPADICTKLASEFDVEPAKLEADVSRFLNDLVKQDLLIKG